ncbi:mixed lineage kinase domain-like protein [Genypterus blacodes]|uniref:mixed lineage kinase domain-like protein n=1 Tax=Genypterus blacodes TaxID=154954 RepID=UPI003F768DAA
MEFVEPIFSLAKEIYSLSEKVKANKEQSQRVARRVNAMVDSVRKIDQKKIKNVEKPLKELRSTLISAKELIEKFTSTTRLLRIMKVNRYRDDFNGVNERLDDAIQALSLNVVIERNDEVDGLKDAEELMKFFKADFLKKQAELTELQEVKDNLEKELSSFKDPATTALTGIKDIKPEELTIEIKPIQEGLSSQLYKAEYGGFTVAVKRFINQTDLSELQSDFRREAANLKRFASPNVLRLYGICIKEELGEFLIVMEYCERGTLREFLNGQPNLPWPLKGRMCLDAAQGLNRLHRQELQEKSKVVTNINSSSFLVDQDNRVKLGGLELAKTLTSLQRNNTTDQSKKNSSMCYICPEKMNDRSLKYSKEWEMYSFGIILWEIATGKKPFQGCQGREIYKKVQNKETFQEPLPDDCPPPLAELINACRAYDPFHRPISGVLVDKLRSVVGQMEAQ